MYTVSNNWQALIADENHYFESKVNISGVDYGQDEIFDISVDMRMFGSEQPTVGGCTSSELTLRLLAPSASIQRMAQIRPYIRVTDGTNTSEWIPQGVFFIDTREVTANNDGLDILTLHCYDAMLKTEADYPATTHGWPMTDINVVTEIATIIGVTVDHRTNRLMTAAYQIGLPAGMSMREVLSRIAAMYCGNFIMTYDGELRLVTLTELPEETNYLIDNAYNAITFGGIIEQEYSGPIVSFQSEKSVPMESLVVSIEPVQDLHGYDSPWTAGGGKNLLDPNIVIYKRYLQQVGNPATAYYWRYSTDSASIAIPVTPNTAYTLSRYLTTQSFYRVSTIRLPSLPAENDNTTITTYQNFRTNNVEVFGETHTITTDSEATFLVIQFAGATMRDFVQNGQIELGSSATSYAPYSNICPISGHTAVNVWVKPTHDTTALPTAEIPFGQTVYAGSLNVLTGVLKARPYYASYNGEELVGPWVSSMDKYVSGITPTIGAQIVDMGGTEQTVQLSSAEVSTLLGDNVIWADAGDVNIAFTIENEAVRILV